MTKRTKNKQLLDLQKQLRPKRYYEQKKDKLLWSIYMSFLIIVCYSVALGFNLNFFERKYLNITNSVFIYTSIGLVVWAGIHDWKLKKKSTVKLKGFLIFPKYHKRSWVIVTVILSSISIYFITQVKSQNFNTISYSLNICAFFIFLYWNTYLSVFKRKNDKSIPSYLAALQYIVFAYVPTIASFFITIYPNMYGLVYGISEDQSSIKFVISLCLVGCMLFVVMEQLYLRIFNPPEVTGV